MTEPNWLQAEGREVALLAIFDSVCPVRTNGWRRRSVFTKIRNSPDLLQRNPETQRWFLSEKFEAYVMRKKGYSPVETSNSWAVSRYKPDPYSGKITFFWASDHPEGPSDSRWGWRELAEQGMDIQRVPGDHGTILREPQLHVLAERLKDCLDQALPS